MNNVSYVTLRRATFIMSVMLLSGELHEQCQSCYSQESYINNVSHFTLRRATSTMSVMLLSGELH